MEQPIIKLRNITKTYRVGAFLKRKAAVEGLSLEVLPGDIFGLLGPNGAGKTTTLKVLLGIAFPESGSGTLLGRPLGNRSAHERLGFLPEQPYFYGYLTAEKGLALYGKFFGIEGDNLKNKSHELLDLVSLPRDSHLTLDKYSKGMLQRFGIAQALLNDPELVIMDEPSSGLDPVGQKEVRDILLRLKESGKTIFLSSHQLSEVENICDSVSIVNAGRSVKEGRLSQMLAVGDMTRVILRGGRGVTRDRFPFALSFEQENDLTVVEVESDQVYQTLDIARSLCMELVSSQPRKKSLEELFLETIKEASS